ncbi:MAG: hypothetical protein JWM25_1395 [Thermoleophilia bacterium]|nr:hypothetical protein [Thermoleophilia bacterium]
MNSPYASNLLQQPAPTGPATPRMPAPSHTRSVTHVQAPQPVYAPIQQPAYAPQPVYVTDAPSGGGPGRAISSLVLGLVVILVGVVALIGGYYATKQASPSIDESNLTLRTAAESAYVQNRQRGIEAGRIDAAGASATAGQLRASIARTNAFDTAFQRGVRDGMKSYRAPRASYGGGYRSPSYSSSGGIGQVASAFGIAQNLANSTGAPVDLEIYNG